MKKIKLKTTKWNAVDYLKTDKNMAEYLEAAVDDGDRALISAVRGDIARAKGMTKTVRKSAHTAV